MAGPCDEMFGGCTNFYKTRLGSAWKRGATLGLMYFSNDYRFLPSWSPGLWNSVCISASASLGLFSLNINDGEVRFKSEQYDGYHTTRDVNIILMGRDNSDCPMHGAVTDVNVFSRLLSEGRRTKQLGQGGRLSGHL